MTIAADDLSSNAQAGSLVANLAVAGTLVTSAAGLPITGGKLTKKVQATLNGSAPGTLAAAGDYGAGDVLSQSASEGQGVAWQFPAMARVAGLGGKIVGGYITTSVGAFAAKFTLYLFNANPSASELDDNAALNIVAADRDKLVGMVNFGTDGTDVGDVSLNWMTNTQSVPYCTGAATNLWGILIAVDAETNESASMTVDIELLIEQD